MGEQVKRGQKRMESMKGNGGGWDLKEINREREINRVKRKGNG